MPILATEKFEKMLEEIYDNIVRAKFETKVDYIEQIYTRMLFTKEELQGQGLQQ